MRELQPGDYLTKDELRRLLSSIRSPRDQALFRVAYRHGLRASEVGLLRVSDVDLKRRRIFCRRMKGSWSSHQLLGDDEVKLLRPLVARFSDPQAPLFISRKGNGISRQRLDALMKRYGILAGIPKEKRHIHALKHSFGVHLIEAGTDIAVIQDLMGHKNIENTRVYAKMSSPRRDEIHRELLAGGALV